MIRFDIYSSASPPFGFDVKELYIPAKNGKAGVLMDHLPYLTILESGEVSCIDTAGKGHFFYVNDGILEACNNKVILISDSLIKGEDLDSDGVKRELEAVENRIKLASTGETSPEELEEALTVHRKLKTQMEILRKLNR